MHFISIIMTSAPPQIIIPEAGDPCCKVRRVWNCPDGPVVKTPCFHCPGEWAPSLVGELRSHMLWVNNMAKKIGRPKMEKQAEI